MPVHPLLRKLYECYERNHRAMDRAREARERFLGQPNEDEMKKARRAIERFYAS